MSSMEMTSNATDRGTLSVGMSPSQCSASRLQPQHGHPLFRCLQADRLDWTRRSTGTICIRRCWDRWGTVIATLFTYCGKLCRYMGVSNENRNEPTSGRLESLEQDTLRSVSWCTINTATSTSGPVAMDTNDDSESLTVLRFIPAPRSSSPFKRSGEISS